MLYVTIKNTTTTNAQCQDRERDGREQKINKKIY